MPCTRWEAFLIAPASSRLDGVHDARVPAVAVAEVALDLLGQISHAQDDVSEALGPESAKSGAQGRASLLCRPWPSADRPPVGVDLVPQVHPSRTAFPLPLLDDISEGQHHPISDNAASVCLEHSSLPQDMKPHGRAGLHHGLANSKIRQESSSRKTR